jgi:hypothetical protein
LAISRTEQIDDLAKQDRAYALRQTILQRRHSGLPSIASGCWAGLLGPIFGRFLPYREISVDRDTAAETQILKQAQGGRKPGRKAKENDQTLRKATETQGPCPDLGGFCIKALTVN